MMVKKKKLAFIIGFIFIVVGGIVAWRSFFPSSAIVAYDQGRDRTALVAIFNDNKYWLVEESPGVLSFEEHLDTRVVSRDEDDRGKTLQFFVLRVDGKTAGFVSFHRDSAVRGKILYLAVAREYRRRGFAKKLLQYACDQLKKDGMNVAWLITRPTNTPGQRLYKKLGFRKIFEDNEATIFEKRL